MKKVFALATALAWGIGLTACLAEGPDESVEGEGEEEEEAEEVGSAQQEVGVGGLCGPVHGACDEDLTCCPSQISPLSGRCRDLRIDAQNCGACGQPCPSGPWQCLASTCVYFGGP